MTQHAHTSKVQRSLAGFSWRGGFWFLLRDAVEGTSFSLFFLQGGIFFSFLSHTHTRPRGGAESRKRGRLRSPRTARTLRDRETRRDRVVDARRPKRRLRHGRESATCAAPSRLVRRLSRARHRGTSQADGRARAALLRETTGIFTPFSRLPKSHADARKRDICKTFSQNSLS